MSEKWYETAKRLAGKDKTIPTSAFAPILLQPPRNIYQDMWIELKKKAVNSDNIELLKMIVEIEIEVEENMMPKVTLKKPEPLKIIEK